MMFATRTEAFQVAVFMLNRKPFHKLDNLMPDYSWLRSFGCICFPHVDSSMRNKLAPKARQCIFLGYSAINKGYCCFPLSDQEGTHLSSCYLLRNQVFFDIGLFGSYWFSSAWAFHGCDSGFQTSHVYGSVSYPCRC